MREFKFVGEMWAKLTLKQCSAAALKIKKILIKLSNQNEVRMAYVWFFSSWD